MKAPGDRRSRVRFEVLGSFWGTFDGGDSVRVHDLTHHGALVEAQRPLAVESVQQVCLVLDGQRTLADVRVRHVRPSNTPRGLRYLAGIEFLTSSVAFNDAVDRLIAYRTLPTEIA